MRGRKLTILAAISLAALAVLLCGYFSRYNVMVYHATLAPQGNLLEVRLLGMGFGRGHCKLIWDHGEEPSPGRNGWGPGFHVEHKFTFAPPDVRRSLWNFEGGRSVIAPGITRDHWVLFPIWCLALPCAIAPALWLRRRRRARRRGFAVKTSARPVSGTGLGDKGSG